MSIPQSLRPARACLFGLLALGLAAGCSGNKAPTTTRTSQQQGSEPDDSLQQARETFKRGSDLEACRTGLQQLSTFLAKHPDRKPSSLTDAQRQALLDKERFGLDPDEITEIDSESFTALDGQYLEQCFLLRDVARSLGVDQEPDARRAEAGFAWVMRQVRLREGGDRRPPHAPLLVLRRGAGTALERGLVVVALFEQLGVPGCLLTRPVSEGSPIWGAAALVAADKDRREVLLFDLRLGLPLPGERANETATLAQLTGRPELVKPLTVDEKHAYDLTPEQVKSVQAYLVPSLSSFAPRMRLVQDELAAPEVRTRLWTDPTALLATWETAVRAATGTGAEVRVGKDGVRVLRQFHGPDEGGVERTGLARNLRFALVPWDLLPEPIRTLPGEPGERLQRYFARGFVEGLEPHKPRDLVLHGRFDEAAAELVAARKTFREQKERLRGMEGLEGKLAEWRNAVLNAEGARVRAAAELAKPGVRNPNAPVALEQAQAEVERVWKQGELMLVVLLDGRAAEGREPEAAYQLALCKHEEAVRQQGRARRLGGEAEGMAAREAWADAAASWETFLYDSPSSWRAPHARLLLAETKVALEERPAAVMLLEDLNGDMHRLEKTARLYLAQQLKK